METKKATSKIESIKTTCLCNAGSCETDEDGFYGDVFSAIKQLQDELDEAQKRIHELRKERKSLRIKDEVRLELLDENAQLKTKLDTANKRVTALLCSVTALQAELDEYAKKDN